MRYRLRTLMIVLALGPMVLAASWFAYREYRHRQDQRLILTIPIRIIPQEEDEMILGTELHPDQ
jgi:hypothetical protein